MRGLVGALVVAMAMASSARAEEGFDQKLDAAMGHYQAGKYAEALTEFQAAYALDPQAQVLFNIARCQERLGKSDDAIATYEKFLEVPGSTAQERSKALEYLSSLRKEKAEREKMKSAPPPAAPAASGATTTRAPAPPPPAPASRTLEWTLIAVGGVGVVAGGILGGLALSDRSAIDEETDLAEKTRLDDSRASKALGADVAIGIGAASALIGIILLATGGDEAATTAGLDPGAPGLGFAVGPTGVQLSGQF